MRAIILAAGRGMRLRQADTDHIPKCLLSFGGHSLLERHLRLLRGAGVEEVVLALGYRHELVTQEIERLEWLQRPTVILNPDFESGSMMTVHAVADAMTGGGEVLLMDADVLYDQRIMDALVSGTSAVNRLLIDREFEAGDEPVKVCVCDGVPVEFRKKVAPGIQFDTIGESVGFFRFDESGAARLRALTAGYVTNNQGHLPHEEAVRDLILERSIPVQIVDVTGSPWIEIDFPEDVVRAATDIFPLLNPLAGPR